jgi:hypothetical protein
MDMRGGMYDHRIFLTTRQTCGIEGSPISLFSHDEKMKKRFFFGKKRKMVQVCKFF